MATEKESPSWKLYLSCMRSKYMTPNLELKSILELDFTQHLRNNNIKAVVLDVDNTLTPHEAPLIYDARIKEVVFALKQEFDVALISNRAYGKLSQIQKSLGIPVIASEKRKPHSEPFQMAIKYFGIQPSEIAIIDDRLLTGIAGGNKAGFYTIKVEPVDKKSEPKSIRFARKFEEALLHFYLH